MFEYFQSRQPTELYTFDPKSYGNKTGLPCPICSQPIIHHTSVSLCQCRIFTHRKCFMLWFPQMPETPYDNVKQIELQLTKKSVTETEQLNKVKQDPESATQLSNLNREKPAKQIFNPQCSKPICKNCGGEVVLQYQTRNDFQPHCRPFQNLAIFLLASSLLIVSIIVFMVLISNGVGIVGALISGYSAVLMLLLAIVFGMPVLMKKKWRLTGVKATQKSLQISAFEGLGQNAFAEETRQQMFKQAETL